MPPLLPLFGQFPASSVLAVSIARNEHGGGWELSEQRQQWRHLEIFPNIGQISRIIVGPSATRAEIELRPAIPENLRGNAERIEDWSSSLIESMSKDLKHSEEWACEICGEPARGAKYDIASRTHLPEPDVVVYMHQVCDSTGNNFCCAMLDKQSEWMAAFGGLSPDFPNLDRLAGLQFPLSGSCLNCEDNKTAQSQLNRCGGCELVRYCGYVVGHSIYSPSTTKVVYYYSADCQKSDWKRHKKQLVTEHLGNTYAIRTASPLAGKATSLAVNS
ncbi:hypothetical protein BJ912DRAFT_1047906, partial [Pholiota molesta]